MTQTITLKGKAYWAKVFPQNKDETGYDNTLTELGGQYTIDLDLDDDSLNELSQSGSQAPTYPKEGKNNAGDAITLYRFKRLHQKLDRQGNLLEWASGEPKVLNADGDEWSIDVDGWIGNESEVEVDVVVYKAGKLTGTRLEVIRVIENVGMEG